MKRKRKAYALGTSTGTQPVVSSQYFNELDIPGLQVLFFKKERNAKLLIKLEDLADVSQICVHTHVVRLPEGILQMCPRSAYLAPCSGKHRPQTTLQLQPDRGLLRVSPWLQVTWHSQTKPAVVSMRLQRGRRPVQFRVGSLQTVLQSPRRTFVCISSRLRCHQNNVHTYTYHQYRTQCTWGGMAAGKLELEDVSAAQQF